MFIWSICTREYLYRIYLGMITLANSSQAKKRARQAIKRRARNVGMGSMYRTFIKKVVYAIEAGDKAAAETAYKAAVPVIDRICGKGLVHANKAARHKSRLNARVRAMA
ncbi:SSU ribosomal protein S20p [hydrothermal vent metagenome]|uniref:SSU ribosomal protein S20p n=1 Tax=hydrothermal vent metagenome TaxID=652676 RepID=A0A3B0X0G3_9ZZZZ